MNVQKDESKSQVHALPGDQWAEPVPEHMDWIDSQLLTGRISLKSLLFN